MSVNGARVFDWDKRLVLLLVGLTIWRLFYLVAAPLDLSPDEAYYWDWSRQPAWGYYSKPPMVAWLMALSTRFFGATAFAVRLPAVVLATAGMLALYALGRRLYGPKVGFWAAVAFAAAPGSCVAGLIMTIDAPLLCFWAISLYSVWRALEAGSECWAAWMGAGLVVGLGILSKQTMVTFLPILLTFLVLSPEDRGHLRRPGPYLLATVAMLALTPVLWWNAEHSWITFQHTAHHFNTDRAGPGLSLSAFGDFVASQLGVVSPLTWGLLLVVAVAGLVTLRVQERKARYLLLFSALPLAAVLVLSLRQRVNANWPAPFYLAGLVLLSAWAAERVSGGLPADRLRPLFPPALALGGFLAVSTYALPWFLPFIGMDGGRFDITARLRGWKELGRHVGVVLQASPQPERTFLLATKRQVVSELAFYVPGQPNVFRWSGKTREVRSQYEIWPGPRDRIGWDALVVQEAGRKLPEDLVSTFQSLEPFGEVVIPLGAQGERRFELFRGFGLQTWLDSAASGPGRASEEKGDDEC